MSAKTLWGRCPRCHRKAAYHLGLDGKTKHFHSHMSGSQVCGSKASS